MPRPDSARPSPRRTCPTGHEGVATLTTVTDSANRSDPANRSDRGEQTRAAIAAAAQELFLERGYDKTTMRAVADRAGVSIGNAYYYFASKEHLVQAFYDHIQVEHAAAAHEALAASEKFADRLRADGVALEVDRALFSARRRSNRWKTWSPVVRCLTRSPRPWQNCPKNNGQRSC